ncbi:MAG: thermonuclease family protein [Thermomicrobiales bacterium]
MPAGIPADAQQGRVVEVYDGDTLMVDIDDTIQTVRLLGIDTPETRETDKGPVECYGSESSDYVRRLVGDRTVWLERDVSDRDADNGLPRYVWVVAHEGDRAYMVNEHLVRQGYAIISPRPPDRVYDTRFAEAQDAAIAAHAGLWAACGGADTPLAPPPTATSTVLDPLITECGAFGTYDEVNAYYASRPDAQPFLDPNADGRACEVWFGVG